MVRIAIIGCGLIGHKRAQSLGVGELVAVSDRDHDRATALAARYPQCAVDADWRETVRRPEIEAVIIATTHDSLAEIALAAVGAGKDVLVEKPAARNTTELRPVLAAAQRNKALVRVGFNHRYHRAFRQARRIADTGTLGPLLYIRARYGHGGRIGYDREWRADPALSGGGELIDQGVHLIDLSRWFLGDFTEVHGSIHTYFWKMPVEDNGFLTLHTSDRQVAWLHASCTEWKNIFSFELFGERGKLEVSGLGGSYGVERLTHYQMLPEMGPPETTAWEYPMADDSWAVELAEFLDDIRIRRQPAVGLADAHAALAIVEQVYRGSIA